MDKGFAKRIHIAKARGSKWPFLARKQRFELLGPLEPPKSALRGPILLAHKNSGHKQPRITRVRFLGQKKLSRAF